VHPPGQGVPRRQAQHDQLRRWHRGGRVPGPELGGGQGDGLRGGEERLRVHLQAADEGVRDPPPPGAGHVEDPLPAHHPHSLVVLVEARAVSLQFRIGHDPGRLQGVLGPQAEFGLERLDQRLVLGPEERGGLGGHRQEEKQGKGKAYERRHEISWAPGADLPEPDGRTSPASWPRAPTGSESR